MKRRLIKAEVSTTNRASIVWGLVKPSGMQRNAPGFEINGPTARKAEESHPSMPLRDADSKDLAKMKKRIA